MTDKKLTDNDIIKALECCSKPYCNDNKCPLHKNTINTKDCITQMSVNALDLINRQKAEIENLKQDTIQKLQDSLNRANEYGLDTDKENQQLKSEIDNLKIELQAMRGAANSYKAEVERLEKNLKETFAEIEALKQINLHYKAEAVKEFAERYERYLLSQLTSASLDKKEWINFCLEELDNLKKETAGEG